MFQEGHLLCSDQDISSVPIKTSARSQERHVLVLNEHMWRNLGRTDLTISQSKVKFDARADGDVRLAVRRPKPHKNSEKRNFFFRKFRRKFFFGVEKLFVGNRPKRVFANFRADPSQV